MLRGGRSQRPSHGRDYQPRHSCKRKGAGQGHPSPGAGASLGFGQWDSGFAEPSTNQPWARLRAPTSQGRGARGDRPPPGSSPQRPHVAKGKPSACEGAATHTPRWLASGRQEARAPPRPPLLTEACQPGHSCDASRSHISGWGAPGPRSHSLRGLGMPRAPLCSQPLPWTCC